MSDGSPVQITKDDIENDGKPGVKEKTASAKIGGQIVFEMAGGAVGQYSFKGMQSRAVTVTSVTPSTVSVSEAQAYLDPSSSDQDDYNSLTIRISENAVPCQINCNLRIKMPDGAHKAFDPIINILPK